MQKIPGQQEDSSPLIPSDKSSHSRPRLFCRDQQTRQARQNVPILVSKLQISLQSAVSQLWSPDANNERRAVPKAEQGKRLPSAHFRLRRHASCGIASFHSESRQSRTKHVRQSLVICGVLDQDSCSLPQTAETYAKSAHRQKSQDRKKWLVLSNHPTKAIGFQYRSVRLKQVLCSLP